MALSDGISVSAGVGVGVSISAGAIVSVGGGMTVWRNRSPECLRDGWCWRQHQR